MDLLLAFLIFASAMTGALAWGRSMLWAIGAGFFAFLWVGLRRGFPLKALLKMAAAGGRDSLIVVRIMLTIGVLAGLWRSAGTFAIFTAWGLRLIAPRLFVLAAFLLACLLSYAIGTSFGTAGTMGVALMALARGGGVNEIVTAGAILSGLYFGDRGSPASSCANLVTSWTSTDLYGNVRRMMRTAFLPFLLSLGFYLLLSFYNPLKNVDSSMLEALEQGFNLSPWAIAPAALMLLLPLLGVKVLYAFGASIAVAFACTVLLQGVDVPGAISCALTGFHAPAGSVRALFNGGGLVSMLELSLVLVISGTYSGILDGTRALEGVEARLVEWANRTGAFPVTTAVGVLADAVLCNQTVGVMITNQLMKGPYERLGIGRPELALDIANSTVPLAGIIPWCLGCSFPLAMMEVSLLAVPLAVYLYLLPICYFLLKRRRGISAF